MVSTSHWVEVGGHTRSTSHWVEVGGHTRSTSHWVEVGGTLDQHHTGLK